MIVGSKEIRTKGIFGTYQKYTYICHSYHCPQGVESYVYCTSWQDFQKLLLHWVEVASGSPYKALGYCYTLSLRGYGGEPITLTDIPTDNNFKVKVFLTCPRTGVSYIQ